MCSIQERNSKTMSLRSLIGEALRNDSLKGNKRSSTTSKQLIYESSRQEDMTLVKASFKELKRVQKVRAKDEANLIQ